MTDDKRTGAERIADERKRQLRGENWNASHDDRHCRESIAAAAACYAAPFAIYAREEYQHGVQFQNAWPWAHVWDKREPRDLNLHHRASSLQHDAESRAKRIRELEKAGALCAAEIDRLLRLGGER